jgi:DNA-binding NtrC family response regulator/pSer/pThr/pTyr-binding forkhead associated (FHA) protein
MPSLIVRQGRAGAAVFDIPGEACSIGRDPDEDVFLDHRTVSRNHAVVLLRHGMWHVTDRASHNGVLLNGRHVKEAGLTHGDRIGIGKFVLEFHDAPDTVADGEWSAEMTQTLSVKELREVMESARLGGMSASQADLRLSHLLRFGELATLAPDAGFVCRELTDLLPRSLPADRVVPLLLDEGPLHIHGMAPGFLQRCLTQGCSATVVSDTPRRVVACVPMQIGPIPLGVLFCERIGGTDPFPESDLRYLLTIAGLSAAAIDAAGQRARTNARLRSMAHQLDERYPLIGDCPAMQDLRKMLWKIAPKVQGVLICGESGTGKEVVARALHRLDPRADGPFEAINCAAMPTELFEAELFGHVQGAFSGAIADRPGRFELADGGTLFLDEVAEMPLECQAKLLRAVESATVRRVGDSRERPVDVHIIAATNRVPEDAVKQGRLRADLFYRLDRLRITVPPLRDRPGDLAPLVDHFLHQTADQVKQRAPCISADALQLMAAWTWPGNVRELRNVVERMVIMSDGGELTPADLPDDIRLGAGQDGDMSLKDAERRCIKRALLRTGGNKKQAAAALGIDRSTLYAKLRRYADDD